VNGNCQAYDDVGGNYWYDNTTKEGNYWSNWNGSGWGTPNAYPIAGGAGACDMYPLSQPWTGVATLSERCSGEGFGCGDWQCSEQLVYVQISQCLPYIGMVASDVEACGMHFLALDAQKSARVNLYPFRFL